MTQPKGARTEPALPFSLTGRVENFRDFESTEFARESEFPGRVREWSRLLRMLERPSDQLKKGMEK
jgi:phytoene dehydrogenase-like protein